MPLITRITTTLLLACVGVSAVQRAAPPTELWVFASPWDARSDSSLRVNAARIDVAVTGWIGIDSVTAQPIIPALFPDTMRLGARALKRMAIVTSWHGDRFHPSTVRALARDDAKLARAASAIASHAASMRYAGLVLDLEALERADLPGLLRVVKAIADSAHKRGVAQIIVAIPAADSAYPAKAIVGVADFVMPMLYDQHWSTSTPGPIAEPSWVRAALAARVAEVGASRIVAALPTYGYRWTKPGASAEPVSFAEAKRFASQSRVALARDARSNTLRAVKPGEWEIWVTDAELLAALERESIAAGVQRVALWRISQEDPGIWRALGR